MAEKAEAFQAILEDIQDQAGLVINQIKDEVEQMQQEEISFFKESLNKETGHFCEKEMSELLLLSATKTSQAKLKIKRDLLSVRQEMVAQLFSSVEKELQEFVASSEYSQLLETKLLAHPEWLKMTGSFTVRQEDVELMKKLVKKNSFNHEVNVGAIKLGGFKFISNDEGIELDETLDNAVRTQKEWFQNHSGFTLN